MNDHREPIPSAPVHLLGDHLLPACGGGGGPGEGGWCRMTPVSADVTCAPCRLVELRDPAGPTFVSPSGDRRERAVPCQRCRRSKTYALRGVCVPCLEAELADGPACSGERYPVNPDVPGEGSDVVHSGPCSMHPGDELSHSATTYPARRSSAGGSDVDLVPAWAR